MVLFPMPGTIQVTVLEFKGVSSSSKTSAKSLKVSMGKRQYQTWDKGDFSFPITKLREDLVVSLLDAAGNEIAHQGIQIIQIIEKGSWDEVFSINGGGHVHMKLQFILSDEDRNRIRVMRESAMKKKLEMNPSIKHRFSEAVASTSDSVEISRKHEQKVVTDLVSPEVVEACSQAGSSLSSASASASSSAVSLSSLSKPVGSVLESSIPNGPDGSRRGAPPYSPAKQGLKIVSSPRVQERVLSISDKNNSVASKLQDDRPILNQDSVEKTPSNVRKMISAFENCQIQEVKSLKKAKSVPSQLNRLRKEGLLEVSSNSSESSSVAAEGSGSGNGRRTSLKSSTMINIHLASDMKQKTLEYYEEEEYYSAQISGMWIFPDNARRLCITTAGKPIINTVGHHNNEAKTHRANKISSELEVVEKTLMHKKEDKMEKNQEQVAESGCGSSPDDDSSNGLVGQVIKIAVIIGFGVLVLLTRQKEPRKKQKEDNDKSLL